MDFMLAKVYDGRDPSGWMLAEKLDGFRARWTGAELVSRNGRTFRAPDWFLAQLPAIPLDGELYAGRGRLSTVAGTVRKPVPVDAQWRHIRYMVFDAPEAAGGFEERLVAATHAVERSGVAQAVAHRPCAGRSDLSEQFRAVVDAGGEGVMLRRPGSPYDPRRTDALLKVKTDQKLGASAANNGACDKVEMPTAVHRRKSWSRPPYRPRSGHL